MADDESNPVMGPDLSVRYRIPVPARFRAAPLVRIPWGLRSVPRMLSNAGNARAALIEKIKVAYGVKHCILTDSARSAYTIAVKGMELEGELILPSIIYTPLGMLLAHHGLELVFCDIGRNFVLTLDRVKPLLSDRTAAVFVDHMFGQVAPADQVWGWAKENSLRVLANMAHMPSTVTVAGKPLAAFCDAGFLSFHWDKPIPGIHGGALITDSDEIYERASQVSLGSVPKRDGLGLLARALSLYRYKPLLALPQYLYLSMKRDYRRHDAVRDGYTSSRGTASPGYHPREIHPWQAAIAERQMSQLTELVERRIGLAEQAIELLSDIPELTLPGSGAYPHTFIFFPVIVDPSVSRYELGAALARRGVEAKWRYYPLPLQSPFEHCRTGDLINTKTLWKQLLLLPVTHGSTADVEHVAAAMHDAIRELR